MFFFECPSCSNRVALCASMPPKTYKCPSCSIAIAFVYTTRSLVEKIKDAYTPSDLIQTIKE